jgi:hypothetical protein
VGVLFWGRLGGYRAVGRGNIDTCLSPRVVVVAVVEEGSLEPPNYS